MPGLRKLLENLIKVEIAKRLVFPRAIAVPLDLDDFEIYGSPDTVATEDDKPIIGGVMYLAPLEMRGVPVALPSSSAGKSFFGLTRPSFTAQANQKSRTPPMLTARAWISTYANQERVSFWLSHTQEVEVYFQSCNSLFAVSQYLLRLLTTK